MSLKKKVIGEAVASVITGAAVMMNTTPHMQKDSGVLVVAPSPNFNGTLVVEKSDDGGDTWTTVKTVTGSNNAASFDEVAMAGQYRYDCTAFTAGSISIGILA